MQTQFANHALLLYYGMQLQVNAYLIALITLTIVRHSMLVSAIADFMSLEISVMYVQLEQSMILPLKLVRMVKIVPDYMKFIIWVYAFAMQDISELMNHVEFVHLVQYTMRQFLTVYRIVDSIKFTIIQQHHVYAIKQMDTTK